MKLWEVMRALEQDPKKTYELKDGNGRTWTITTDYDYDYPELKVCYMIDCTTDADIHANINPSDDGWYEVKQPVTWQEAIQAWADNKRVVWEDDEERRVFDRKNGRFNPKQGTHMVDQVGGAVSVRMIFGGAWYVED